MMKIQEKCAGYGWVNLTRVEGGDDAGCRVLAAYNKNYPSRTHRLVEILPGGNRDPKNSERGNHPISRT